MARPGRLNDPEFAKLVAESYVAGLNIKEMADQFDVSADSIRIWVKDPRVVAHSSRLTTERINRITRRIDGEIEGRLMRVKDMKTDELIKLRREYTAHAFKLREQGVDADGVVNELTEAMDSDSTLAEELTKLISRDK